MIIILRRTAVSKIISAAAKSSVSLSSRRHCALYDRLYSSPLFSSLLPLLLSVSHKHMFQKGPSETDLGATEAKVVPRRDARREDDRDDELSRGEEAEVTHKERPKKPLLTVNFWTTMLSATDFLSANVVPTAEAADTALETVAISNPLSFTTAQPFHEPFVTHKAPLDP